jgi:tetratricopeptide (TPR) repeat protein
MSASGARTLAILALSMMFGLAVGSGPASAVGDDNPAPPPAPSGDSKAKPLKGKQKATDKKKQKSSEQEFRDGYRRAYDLIQRGEYDAGIAAMHTLGHDEHPDVANYIGYANRKLGHYDEAKVWYEKALAADPKHVRTWSYYGMWHAEQGNRLKAEDHLQTIRLICGNEDCREYRMLKDVIDGTTTY